jgi:hypothetical protein
MEQVIACRNDSGYAARGLRLNFALTRTEVRAVDVSGLPAGARITRRLVVERGVEVWWNEPLLPGASVDVRVDAEGEPLTVSAPEWLVAADRVVASTERLEATVVSVDAEHVTAAKIVTEQTTLAAAFDKKPSDVELFEMRMKRIGETKDETVRRYQLFFADYDKNTHFSLLQHLSPTERQKRMDTLIPAGTLLRARVIARCRAACRKQVPGVGALDLSPKTQVSDLSKLQLAIYHEHFGDKTKSATFDLAAFDLRAFNDAMMRFANGNLSIKVFEEGFTQAWGCQPDSAFAFSFAEFAFMAIESKVDAPIWTTLLPVFVALQGVYYTVYTPVDAEPPFEFLDYGLRDPDTLQQFSLEQLAARLADHTGKDVTELARRAGKNAFAAFPANAMKNGKCV